MKTIFRLVLCCAVATGLWGCPDDGDGEDNGAGGTPAAGGQSSTGGSPAMGGAPAMGGEPTMGGAPAMGGAPTMGGAPAMGGAPTMGGAPAMGGEPAMGGDPAMGGEPAAGGAPAMGGEPAMGGTPMGGEPAMGGAMPAPEPERLPCDGSRPPGDYAECTTNIYTLKIDDAIADDTVVGVTGIVTGRRIGAQDNVSHLIIQVDADDPGYAGPAFSGLWIYLNEAPDAIKDNPPTDGQVIYIVGAPENYYGKRQLNGVTHLEVVREGVMPPAVNAMPENLMTDGVDAWRYEGVLVEVRDVVVTEVEPAPAGGEEAPTNEFRVNFADQAEGGVRVDDWIHRYEAVPAVGTAFSTVRGILTYTRNNSKILLRSAGDLIE